MFTDPSPKFPFFQFIMMVIFILIVVLSVLAGIEEGDRKEYIRNSVKVGLEFKESKFVEMVEDNTEWTKYRAGYGLIKFKAVFFTVKNDTIVSVWTGYGLP